MSASREVKLCLLGWTEFNPAVAGIMTKQRWKVMPTQATTQDRLVAHFSLAKFGKREGTKGTCKIYEI